VGHPMLEVREPRIQNFFHAAKFGTPSLLHVVDSLIEMRTQLADSSVQVAKPGVIDKNAD
jgi:hypothetical protein